MCGICGVVGKDVDKYVLRDMTDSLSHRGPDDKGYYLDRNIGLGHRRLSIIDIQNGAQPMRTKNGKYVIVFNGEIYNFKELREDLEKKNYNFQTNSDTEVILHLYQEYGKECLKFLDGMFAFAIYDLKENVLFLARDRLGIKPLYYYVGDGKLVFASEIKSILKHPAVRKEINHDTLYEFFMRQYISAPDTIFNGIKKLEAGHYLSLSSRGIKRRKYWDLEYLPKFGDESLAMSELRKLLEKSVQRRLIADVPLGAFLSGGVDSSIIVSLMKKFKGEGVKTFSVGFEDKEYDESKYAQLVSEKFETDHQSMILNEEHMGVMDKVIYHLDEPLSDFAALPTYLLSEMARSKVKVVLTGEGGDENFAGYGYYQKAEKALSLGKFVPGIGKKLKGMQSKEGIYGLKVFNYDRFDKFLKFKNKDFLRRKLVLGKFGSSHFLNEMLRWDTKIWLPDDLLMKVDKMTMAASLEARVPFLDHKLMEFTSSLEPKLKREKYLLKKTFAREIPKEIFERSKQGFDVPVEKWFNTSYRENVDQTLEDGARVLGKYFDKDKVEKMMKNDRDNLFLWRLYNFLVWHNKFLKL